MERKGGCRGGVITIKIYETFFSLSLACKKIQITLHLLDSFLSPQCSQTTTFQWNLSLFCCCCVCVSEARWWWWRRWDVQCGKTQQWRLALNNNSSRGSCVCVCSRDLGGFPSFLSNVASKEIRRRWEKFFIFFSWRTILNFDKMSLLSSPFFKTSALSLGACASLR